MLGNETKGKETQQSETLIRLLAGGSCRVKEHLGAQTLCLHLRAIPSSFSHSSEIMGTSQF